MPSRYVVVGAGGVGQWLLELLSRYTEYSDPGSSIVIVDGDHFEPKNFERQHFAMMGNKAEVKAFELQERYDRTNYVPMPLWVVDAVEESEEEEEEDPGPQNKIAAADLFAEDDIVFLAVDNFAARKTCFDAAQKMKNVDVFTGGNGGLGANPFSGSVYHYRVRSGVELTEHPGFYHPELVEPPDKNPGELSCAELAMMDGGTQLAAANMGVAAFIMARFYAAHTKVVEGDGLGESEVFFDLGEGVAAAFDRKTENPVPTKKQAKARTKKQLQGAK